MDNGFPLFMAIAPIVAGGIALALRGYRRAAVVIGMVSSAVLTTLLWLATPVEGLLADNVAGIFGRQLVLSPQVRSLFLFIYPALGVLFALTWFRPAGRALVPLGLLMLSPLAATLMVTPASLGAVLLLFATALALPILHGGRFDAAAATWRYFLLAAPGLSLLLLVDSPLLTSGAAAGWAGTLPAVLILLGGFPFYIWVSDLSRLSTIPAVTLVLGLMQIVVITFVFILLDSEPAVRASTEFQTAVRWSAAITALVAVFQIGRAADWRGIIAGAVLLDMGFMLTTALAPSADGLLIALPLLINRYLSLLILTLGLSLPAEWSSDGRAFPSRLRLESRLRPALMLIGLFSLVGLPLTPGFAGRTSQLAIAGANGSALPPILLVLVMTLATYFILRKSERLLQETDDPEVRVSGGYITLCLILIGIVVILGFLPYFLLHYVSRMLGLI